ncbi:MAG: type I-B CRISPR-associated endonuclease Cas1 [Candidatus Altiarchaeum hamiconexum]|uniref:CRISPR-associated endonuclease Cas1 n=1 Tax=Candidatus Altarchaeum hamiconexum TaxID=1803513 RepID=A0A8J7YVJ5_9ARCH|nr:type I-B CRISPR-associated endonuclease Cas1 [Candidatus Altarchaeum hamiconexum]OIQ05274.1 MAG: subtype I-B CRISPR-associated endonuclease Cas1 [Candidatus Altarchaeum sp. CG2_30_32_3053]PIN67214.1 MAG: subtype I-B CRISPR-associated endonuclease Cas1 [Candidatus Altarchaeum sp. CG12_big_fil_rev_8_21_14_0_65_33_22]PIZ29275.1 MAG: subtype I-B CRISPR-associated endonuclease Cas1 [Candidatus Altarchaeum sp. CG_4_10_14_0_8_um_filter_32_851]NCN69435.1 type I-B CRISPR-associated endonuclease Cas1 
MKQPLYLTTEGILEREGNTIYFIREGEKKAVPINNISEILCLARVSLRSGAIAFLFENCVPVHFLNMYGHYTGSLYPKDFLIAGKVLVRQVEYCIDKEKRLNIAKEFVRGIKYNTLKTLKYYSNRGKDINFEDIENLNPDKAADIHTLMSVEGKIWDNYYKNFNEILKNFELENRERRPPTNEINALISFGNSLLYSTTLSEIYNTYLNPAVSFLHEPQERRYSLALDISEIFKPLLVERIIFKLVNKQMLTEKHFESELKGVYLNDEGRRVYLKEYDERLNTTIKHPTLERKVSYRRLIRLECYKIVRHIIEDGEYKCFKMWW